MWIRIMNDTPCVEAAQVRNYHQSSQSVATRLLSHGQHKSHIWCSPCKCQCHIHKWHYNDVIMSAIASQITSLTIVYSIVYLGADQRKHQSSASLAFVRGIYRWPVNSPHKGPVTRKMFPLHDVIMTELFITAHVDVLAPKGAKPSAYRAWIKNYTHTYTYTHIYIYFFASMVINVPLSLYQT